MAGEAHNMDLDSVATDRFAQDRNEAAFYEQAGYRQEAAMRLAQQKKVSFVPEQLSFNMNVDNTGLFAGEQPAPITVNNPSKNGGGSKNRKRSKSAKRSASGKRMTSAYSGGKQTYD